MAQWVLKDHAGCSGRCLLCKRRYSSCILAEERDWSACMPTGPVVMELRPTLRVLKPAPPG